NLDNHDPQHIPFFSGITWPGPGTTIFLPDKDTVSPFPRSSPAARFFLFTMLKISVKTVKNASSTLVASRAEVSRKKSPSFWANSLASSVGTALWSSRSHLFPTRIITMFLSAWERNSSSQRGMWSKLHPYLSCPAVSQI
ncbi:DEGP protease 2, partial [Striga asiatica]